MASAGRQIKSALWAFFALALIGWILGLIGLAGIQRQCFSTPAVGGSSALSSSLQLVGIRGLNRSYTCERMYGFYWFMLAAEFVTLAGLAALTATGLLAASALSWLSWFAVMALLFIQGSDTFLAVSRLGLSGRTYSFAALTAAGWIIMSIANLALVFLLGWRPRRQSEAAGGPIKY